MVLRARPSKRARDSRLSIPLGVVIPLPEIGVSTFFTRRLSSHPCFVSTDASAKERHDEIKTSRVMRIVAGKEDGVSDVGCGRKASKKCFSIAPSRRIDYLAFGDVWQ